MYTVYTSTYRLSLRLLGIYYCIKCATFYCIDSPFIIKRSIHLCTHQIHVFYFSCLFLLISSFCSFLLRAELKCLTPLNSSRLLSVSETSSCSTNDVTSTNAFITATSIIDATPNGTIVTLNDHGNGNGAGDNYDDDYDDNRNHSRYSNCTYFQTPILKSNKSNAFQNVQRRCLNTSVLRKLKALSKLSVSHRDQINIEASSQSNCMCDANTTDGNCLKSFMEMSVTPAEYRSTNSMVTSTPIMAAPIIIGKDVINYDHSIFSIARVKKVELHDLSPKVNEFSGRCWANFQFKIYKHIWFCALTPYSFIIIIYYWLFHRIKDARGESDKWNK